MRYVLALLFAVVSIQSYAGPWEYSLTGIAILPSGQKGIEVARYVWDPNTVTYCGDFSRYGNPGPPCSSVGYPYPRMTEEVWQAPATFSYFGLVNGTGTGVVEIAHDCCVWELTLGGSHDAEVPVPSRLMNPIEQTFVTDTLLQWSGWSGGEDGWRWVGAYLGLPEERFVIESIRPLFVSEPTTLSLIALGALFACGIRRAKVPQH